MDLLQPKRPRASRRGNKSPFPIPTKTFPARADRGSALQLRRRNGCVGQRQRDNRPPRLGLPVRGSGLCAVAGLDRRRRRARGRRPSRKPFPGLWPEDAIGHEASAPLEHAQGRFSVRIKSAVNGEVEQPLRLRDRRALGATPQCGPLLSVLRGNWRRRRLARQKRRHFPSERRHVEIRIDLPPELGRVFFVAAAHVGPAPNFLRIAATPRW